MGTTRSDLSGWFDEGVKQGATHMVVVCDTFSHEDFPVYVMPDGDVQKVVAEKGAGPRGAAENRSMSRVMEVYAMHLDKAMQLSEGRSFHCEKPGEEPTLEAELGRELGMNEKVLTEMLTQALMKPIDLNGMKPDWDKAEADLDKVCKAVLSTIDIESWKNICAAKEEDADRIETYVLGALVRTAAGGEPGEIAIMNVLSRIALGRR